MRSNITNAELVAKFREWIVDPAVPLELSPWLMVAAARLSSRGEITEATIQKAALAAAIAEGCGLTVDGVRMICNDPRAPGEVWQERCSCLNCARAALEVTTAGEE